LIPIKPNRFHLGRPDNAELWRGGRRLSLPAALPRHGTIFAGGVNIR